jgi:prepilin-type N-terminal cleavage/methylation domain-containing protein
MNLLNNFAARRRLARERGFTMVEIMIVVAIIAILVTIAWPSYMRARERSQNTRVINDLRVFTDAFQQYATENRGSAATNGWPPDQMPAVFPPEMAGMIKEDRFAAGPSWGGNYDWDVGVYDIVASMSIEAPQAPYSQLEAMDRMFDDGNLGTGAFREAPGRVLYVLEEETP